MGIYIECMQHPNEIIYHMPFLYKLGKEIDLFRLRDAFYKVIKAHPSFYACIGSDESGSPCMWEKKDTELTIDIVEMEDVESVKYVLPKYFSLDGSVPVYLRLFSTPQCNYFLFQIHHTITDGYSATVFWEEVNRAYCGEEIDPEEYTIFQAAMDERILRNGSQEYEKAREWYENNFNCTDVETLLIPDRNERGFKIGKASYDLDIDRHTLKNLINTSGVKKGTLFTSMFAILLSKFMGDNQALFSTIWHGRADKKLSRTMGMFVKTLPLYCRVDDSMSLSELFRQSDAMIRGAREHSIFSYADVCSHLDIKTSCLFAYQGYLLNNVRIDGHLLTFEDLELSATTEPLTVQVYEKLDGSYMAMVEYQENMYSRELIDQLLESYSALFKNAADGNTLVGELQLTTRKQLQLLDSFNETAFEYNAQDTLISLFNRQVQLNGDKTAVVYKEKRYTYQQVNEISNRIASRLISSGLQREDVVSILIPRSEWMPIASLGVLKAGCAYQPLDPTYPQDRLQFMTQDASSKFLIADRELAASINLNVPQILYSDEILSLAEPATLPDAVITPSSLCVLLYTSGSTGLPKGCMVEHRNIVAFCRSHSKIVQLDSGSRVAAYASYGFDANIMDTYPALSNGAELHILPEEIRLDLVALGNYFDTNGITHSFMTTQVGYQFVTNVECRTLEHFMLGGEKLAPIDPPKNVSLYNLYGPTEGTVYVTAFKVEKKEENIPIGKAVPNSKLYIVDSQGRRLPVGATGELWAAGPQISRGYLNRDEQTNKAYTSNPFCDLPSFGKVYHTGDIVRYLPDGNIQFVGRRDGQVKIRGFRIELKEIEGVIREYPGIKDVTVQAFDEEGGGKFIAAYIVSDEHITISALNDFILDRKPPYMVPAVTMQIESIPLNQNQKVDRKALPVPEKGSEDSMPESNAPMNRLEEDLHQIISGILNTTDFSIVTPLAYAGLTSISSIRLATQLYKKYGVSIDSKSLLKGATLQFIENIILEHLLQGKEDENSDVAGDAPVHQSNYAPLTYAQQGVYFECMKNPLSTVYNVPFSLEMPENTDVDKIVAALEHLADVHPQLKVHFETREDSVVQVCDPGQAVEVPVQEMDMDGLELEKEQFVRPFHLGKGPLYRFKIVKVPKKTVLLLDIHHLVADGGSVDLFIQQLCSLIEGKEIGKEACGYIQFALEQKEEENGIGFRKSKEFFAKSLSECEGCSELPEDFKAKAEEGKSARLHFPFNLAQVEELSKELEITPAHLMLGVAFYTLHRYTNNRNVYIATVSNGRSNLKIAETVGMFVNTLALHGEIKEQSIADFLRCVSSDFQQSVNHENYPFARIAADYNFSFATNYAYQIGVIANYTIGGKSVAMGELRLETPKQKLDIMICEHDGVPVLQLQYNDALYSEDTIRRFGNSYINVLENFLADPHGSLLKVSMVGKGQETELAALRTVATAENRFHLFHNTLEHWANQTPDSMALVACDSEYTYSEMNCMANRIAHALIARGVRQGDRVALLLPRTSRLILSMFGVLKAGAAYIPCDPDYPADRVNLILEDSGAPYIITAAEHITSELGDKAIDVEELLANGNESDPALTIDPESLAYLIYTSGSTGRPKGVMLRHAGICNYLSGHTANVFANAVMEDAHRILSVTTISFDAALQDIGTSIYHGKTLVVATEEQANNPIELAGFIQDKCVDMVSGTPSRWQTWLTSPDFCKAISNINIARAGGEKFSIQLLEDLRKNTSARIFNCYGPTEITVASNNKELTNAKTVTVGRPQLNVTEFIVDSDGNELPVGVVGELYIGGRGVAAGYNNLDEMTRERFITYKGIPVYKSGDYAKWLPDGDVLILGRTDNQIKLRGLRIELGEVESAIQKVDGIRKVVVLIRKVSGKEHLCAYYTADFPILAETLKGEISKHLTQYMVPTAYLQMDSMPMTPNGKTDVKSLPDPEFAISNVFEAPVNDTEKVFCNLFASILELEKVGATDNFFDLGGTSLVVTRVIIEADKAGLHIAYGDLFAHPTPRALASLFEESDKSAANDNEITGYDYSRIDRLLENNTLDAFRNGEHRNIRSALVTGATGFLGIHILKRLIDSEVGNIYALVRGKDAKLAENRLKTLSFYYFDNTFEDIIGTRLHIVTGDVTDDLESILKGLEIDTIFNCAAIVKHFSEGTEIEDVNIGGAQRCVDYALEHNARLIHISTASTRGLSVNGYPQASEVFDEQRLYFGQFLGNKYIYSKFIAERIILEAVATKGLDAKIMRVGNLSARSTDGEFQANFSTNSFMGRIKVFNMLGCCPHEMRDNPVEFSPIDQVADAIFLLAGTPRECCVFHPYNNHQVMFGDMLSELSSIGSGVRFVEASEFGAVMEEAKSNPDKSRILSSLLAYQDMAHGQKTSDVARQNIYTMQVLYRLGYRWSMTSWDYIDRFLNAIASLGFFDE